MNKQEQHLETLQEIRSLMERSTRFLSLSGLSGVAAGTFALLGAGAVFTYLGVSPLDPASYQEMRHMQLSGGKKWGMEYDTFLLVTGAIVMILATLSGLYFTKRKATKGGYPLFDASAKRLAWNIIVPLGAGGLFCLILLLKHNLVYLIAPATLLFYGLTLINASKYTLDDLRTLGYAEVLLGLLATWFSGYGLLFWSIGFGILHIIYGIKMYWKYER